MPGRHRLQPSILERPRLRVHLPGQIPAEVHAVEHRTVESQAAQGAPEAGGKELRRGDRVGAGAQSREDDERLPGARQAGGQHRHDQGPAVDAAAQDVGEAAGQRGGGREEDERRETQEPDAERAEDDRRPDVRERHGAPSPEQDAAADAEIQEEGAIGWQVGGPELGDVQELRDPPVLGEVGGDAPAVRIRERRGHAERDDPGGPEPLAPWQRRGMEQLGGGEQAEQQDAEVDLDVQVAPQDDDRHGAEERPRRPAAPRPLDEQRAGGEPRERREVRPGQGAGFDDEEPEDQDGQDRRRRGARPARRKGQDEGQRQQRRLRGLDPAAAGEPPRQVAAEIEEPGRVRLRVGAIDEVEQVGVDEAPGGGLASLREVPPQVRVVHRAEADDRGRRHGQRDEQCRPDDRGRRARARGPGTVGWSRRWQHLEKNCRTRRLQRRRFPAPDCIIGRR